MTNSDGQPHFDSFELRSALGRFATGVTVVTALDRQQKPLGMTVNSFSSVSLEPPLVLWSIGRDSLGFDEFLRAEHFAIHVLDEEQRDISQRFSERGNDKFSGINCEKGLAGLPLLPEHIACFECATECHYEGGDHIIVVGRVLRLSQRDGKPLVFYGGDYAALA